MTDGHSPDPRPLDARVTQDMVGARAEPRRVHWNARDTMLYALAVGAGVDDLALTTENSHGTPLRAVPSLLTVLAQGNRPAVMGALDPGRMLHADERIELLRELPPEGEGTLDTRIEAVLDKGENAIVVTVSTLSLDEAGRDILGRVRMGTFIRGGGGFGGPRGTSTPEPDRERAPDVILIQQTRPEQALLYRLTGDRHPLHSDPAFAQERGFPRPILHGLCTFGFACRALVEAAGGGDVGRLRVLEGRFSSPVLPGDRLSTQVWLEEGNRALFRTLDGAGEPVIARGYAEFSA